MTVPVPYGRGAWRLTVHDRQFSSIPWTSTLREELHGARGRRLEQAIDKPATLTFTVDGHSDAAHAVRELQTDVVAWRWDDGRGIDVPYFRGIVAQSEDQITEQSHTVTFTCHDYLSVLDRRYLTSAVTYAQADQDFIVSDLLARGSTALRSSDGLTSFMPGSYVPLMAWPVNGDGSHRSAVSGVLRDRTYTAQSAVGDLLDQLGHVLGGYDYDVRPGWREMSLPNTDVLRVFYPSQGRDRPGEVLEYGGNVSTITRSVNSTDYANWARVIGNNESATADAPQRYSERWNADANNVTVTPVGLWQMADNASDVTDQKTLDEKVAGDLDFAGVLVPSYSLGLRPGTYRDQWLDMGDTVPLVVRSGRLDVTASVRVVGLAFDMSEDGPEVVTLTVGRPLTTLADLLVAGRADVDALARR